MKRNEYSKTVYLCLQCKNPIIKDKRSKKIRSTRFHNGCMSKYLENMDKKQCECGCGEFISPLDINGLPRRFKAGHWAKTEDHRAEKTPNFNGYITMQHGYILVRDLSHPFRDNRGYVPEHRKVWEEHNKAILLKWGIVHHKNHIRHDNRIKNLHAMMKKKHDRLEAYYRKRDERGFFAS